MDFPLVSIVIPTHNRKEKLIRLIDSILSSKYPREKMEIIIVDDASSDGTFETVKNEFSMRMIKIIRNQENQLVSETRNIGFRNSNGEYIFFVDDDVVLDQETIHNLIKFVKEHNANIAGPIIFYFRKPKRVWSAGIKINFWTTFGKYIKQGELDIQISQEPIQSDAMPTAFMMHRSLVDKVGLFNKTLFPVHFEELDFFVRSNLLGYKFQAVPSAKIWHEHTKGAFLINPQKLYFEVRNRLIAHKLWSKSYFQYIVSRIFSTFIPFAYIIIKSTIYTQDYKQCIKSIFKGLWDGLKMCSKIEPYAYYLKRGSDIKYVGSMNDAKS